MGSHHFLKLNKGLLFAPKPAKTSSCASDFCDVKKSSRHKRFDKFTSRLRCKVLEIVLSLISIL